MARSTSARPRPRLPRSRSGSERDRRNTSAADHLHLVAEAKAPAPAKVAEHPRRRELPTPTEVRKTVLHDFQNARHHGARAFGPALDAFSTAMTFDGWLERDARAIVDDPWRPPPRTWLLSRGLQRAGGPLSAYDDPPPSPHVKLVPYEPESIERNVSDARLRELGFLDCRPRRRRSPRAWWTRRSSRGARARTACPKFPRGSGRDARLARRAEGVASWL